jgi:predicted secreted Zn-dependent protease
MPQALRNFNLAGQRMSPPRSRSLLAAALVFLCTTATQSRAEPVITKTYSYFSIGGRTAQDLDAELSRRGPQTNASSFRHPGATEIKFGGDVTYLEGDRSCAISAVRVTLKTRIILPRWKNRNKAEKTLGLIWDTLSADIKRHEERHAEIARGHARDLERALLQLRPAPDCNMMEKRAADVTQRIIQQHDDDQLRFDKVEAANFDARMIRLLQYRSRKAD